jgi:hypothetical protein
MSTTIIIIVNIALSVVLAVGLTPLWVWWERRIAGFIQDRSGPNRCSIGVIRLGGLVQAVADMLKLIFKEDFTPSHIKHKFFFTIAPAIVFIASFLTFAVIPYADVLTIDGKAHTMQAIPNELGIMWFLAFAGLSVYGIILGGYSSQSKYGLLGSIRASAQVISYEARAKNYANNDNNKKYTAETLLNAFSKLEYMVNEYKVDHDVIKDGKRDRKIKLICSKHGESIRFTHQAADTGCLQCRKDFKENKKEIDRVKKRAENNRVKSNKSRTTPVDEVLKILTEKYGDKFSYDITGYENLQSVMTVTCKKHGSFNIFRTSSTGVVLLLLDFTLLFSARFLTRSISFLFSLKSLRHCRHPVSAAWWVNRILSPCLLHINFIFLSLFPSFITS